MSVGGTAPQHLPFGRRIPPLEQGGVRPQLPLRISSPGLKLEPSELILPHEDATLAEVRQMMTDEGLIPG